jgi:hypothetical protein
VIIGNQTGVIFAGSGPDSAPDNPWPNESSDDNTVHGNVISLVGRYTLDESWGGPIGTGNHAYGNCLFELPLTLFTARAPPTDGLPDGFTGVATDRNLTAAPQFAGDPSAGDLRLQPGSACARFVGWT